MKSLFLAFAVILAVVLTPNLSWANGYVSSTSAYFPDVHMMGQNAGVEVVESVFGLFNMDAFAGLGVLPDSMGASHFYGAFDADASLTIKKLTLGVGGSYYTSDVIRSPEGDVHLKVMYQIW